MIDEQQLRLRLAKLVGGIYLSTNHYDIIVNYDILYRNHLLHNMIMIIHGGKQWALSLEHQLDQMLIT